MAEPGSLAGLLANKNLLQLFAGIGAQLDPKGVGGALGIPTSQFISSVAAQERAAENTKAQNAQTELVLQALKQYGGLTPKEVPGVTGVSTGLDGNVKLDITPGAKGNVSAIAPPTTVAPTAPTAAPVVAPTAPTAPTAPQGALEQQQKISALLPFFSALLG